MNRRTVVNTMGHISLVGAGLLALPAVVSLIYLEFNSFWAFLITIGIALAIGLPLTLFVKPSSRVIYAKEGFVMVSFAWLLLSAIGALPFVLCGEIPSYIDALFETVSGFTTTGASILTDVESLSHGMLFWRSFTHWIGGMGVLVFIMALVPNVADRSIHIMRAEMPGPVVGKLVPKARDTAKILYLIYIAMTAVMVILLLCGGDMDLFESLVHAFGTAGTGGFSSKASSIGGYNAYTQWVITVFMIIFGVNFNLYYLIIIGRIKSVLKSSELWFFLGMILASICTIAFNIYSIVGNISDTVRASAFQVASVISTTGYATTDFDLWPGLSKAVLLTLMFIGGCAGSTAGGLKCSRILILLKAIYRELKRLMHPRSVRVVSIEDKKIDEQTISGVTTYFALYAMITLGIFVMICFEPFSLETNFTATVACFNNVGPGFGAVGPTSSFAGYSVFSKLLLSFAMLLGRLEIFPLILGLNPFNWKNRKAPR